MQQIVAIFGNLVKQNIARNGKKVTYILYRVADHSIYKMAIQVLTFW